jgi:hypothetical protein
MTTKMSEEEILMLSQLHRAGIPLDKEVLEGLKVHSRGLSIHQRGTCIDNSVVDLDFGGTGYILSVAIYNDSNRIIRPHEIRLEMPWHESQFRLLENPLTKIPREYTYALPPPGPAGFEREVVLNHHFGGKGRLCPGDCIEGFLLAVGQEPIPVGYRNRQKLQAHLSIFDGPGNRYESRVELFVRREERRTRDRVTEMCGPRDRDTKDNQRRIERTKKVAA